MKFDFEDLPLANYGRFQRREFWRAGLAGLGGLTLPGLFRSRAQAAVQPGRERTAARINI